MNPDWIDMRGAMPGADYSRTRVLGEGHGPSFAGRGPKGWRRSDERVHEDVCEALSMHPALDASDIEVEVHDGVVTLRDTVEDRRSKRLAVDIAESISGVLDVRSELRARSPKERARIDKRREDEVARR
jgi:osmotically-inducible protein OsmY